jgi:hypothetical protein
MITSDITSRQSMRVAMPIITILDNFADLRRAVEQLGTPLHEAGINDIFCSLAWHELLFLHGLEPSNQQPTPCKLILIHHPDQQSLVCLPLLATHTLDSLSNYYSSLYSCLSWSALGSAAAQKRPDRSDCEAFCQTLRQMAPRCPVITLGPLDAGSPFFSEMRAALSRSAYWVDVYFCFGNWYLELAGRSFAQYYPTLPSALRHSIERGQRRLTHAGAWQIQIHQHPGPLLEQATADFAQVYSRSWKKPEPNPDFIPGLIRQAASHGWLRLGILLLAGQPVAAQLWLVKGNKANIFKLAYVSGFERFSVGSVLTQAMMQQVIDLDQVQEVDYLSGDDAYKRDWMSHRRERWGLVAFAPTTPGGLWRALKHFVGKRFKSAGTQRPHQAASSRQAGGPVNS